MKIKNYKGFSLIELIVVMFILATVGTIAVGIFSGTLRGSNKGNSINEVRQNGNYILSQMSKMIAYSKTFEGVSQDNISYSTACSVSATSYKFLKITSFDGGESVFSCNGPSDTPSDTIASGSSSLATRDSLIDTTKMKVTACEIHCVRTSDSLTPTIEILFTLSTQNGGGFVENNSSVSFETTIHPRN